jgi:hypothetical protein
VFHHILSHHKGLATANPLFIIASTIPFLVNLLVQNKCSSDRPILPEHHLLDLKCTLPPLRIRAKKIQVILHLASM